MSGSESNNLNNVLAGAGTNDQSRFLELDSPEVLAGFLQDRLLTGDRTFDLLLEI